MVETTELRSAPQMVSASQAKGSVKASEPVEVHDAFGGSTQIRVSSGETGYVPDGTFTPMVTDSCEH